MIKKMSSVLEHKFAQQALLKLIRDSILTYSEVVVYTFMRSRAFDKKRICKIDHKYIATAIGIHKNKILTKIKKLERLGMLEPIYFVQYQEQIIKFSSYEEAVKKFSLSAIKYKNYYVKRVPGELKLVKGYKENKNKE